MIDLDAVIATYVRKGVLLDTNLLLLHVVGSFKRERVETFHRTRAYTVEDFDLLEMLLEKFDRIVATPNILTEVSNLASQLDEPDRRACREHLAKRILVIGEEFVPSRLAVADSVFNRAGLTDAGILTIARARFLVLTDDVELYTTLEYRHIDVINFNHVRAFV